MCLRKGSCLANSQKHRVFKTILASKRFYVIPPLWNVQKSLHFFTPIGNKFLPQFHQLKMIKIQNNTKVKVRRTAIMRAFYCFIIQTTTCQRPVGNLKLNPLSAQIIIYCLMTNRVLALLEGRASWNPSCSEDMTGWHMTEEGDSFIFPIFSRKIEGDCSQGNLPPATPYKPRRPPSTKAKRSISTVLWKNRGLWTV